MAQTRFSGPVKSDNGFQFETTTDGTDVEGRVNWNTSQRTLDVGLGNGVTLQVGQEFFFIARNTTQNTINNGTAVQFSGAIGNSGRITVEPALAASSTPVEYFVGIATEDIAKNQDGLITYLGKVRGVDTRGGAENWQDGDLLYLSGTTAGALTKIPPDSPTPDILVAAVVNASPNGILLVRPTMPPSLNRISDVLITSPQDGDVLTYDSAQGVWVNQQPV